MAWNGAGNFQRTNGSFSGADVWTDDANAGYDIVDARHDAHDQDLAQGINNCLTKDGQNSPTANLSMNSFKHTNVGDGTARNQYATVGQLQDQGVQAVGSVGGTANAITASMSPNISSYVTGARYFFKAVSTSTGAVTLKVDTAPAVAVQFNGAALVNGEIAAGQYHTVIYDGTVFQLLNPAMSASTRTLPASVGQLQDGSFIWCGTSGGSANAQTLAPSPAITAYAAGQVFRFIAGFSSTGALTLQVSGLASPKTCLMKGSLAPFSNLAYLIAGLEYEALYDGTSFLISDLMDAGQYTNDAGAARIKLFKSRGTTAGTNTIVQNGDGLGQLDFYGANGTGFTRGAYINAIVDGTPGATNDMPTALTFATTADGSGTPTERMRINNSGQMLVGRTTALLADEILSAGSGSGRQMASLEGGNSGTNGGAALSVRLNTNTCVSIGNYSAIIGGTYDSSPVLYFAGGIGTPKVFNLVAGVGSHVMKWDVTTRNWTYDTSSARYKDNIVDSQYGLSDVLAMRPVTFTYKSDPSRHDVGFIAEEMVEIVPEVVAKNIEGEPDAISYDRLTSVLCKAVQELNAKVDAIAARVTALEA